MREYNEMCLGPWGAQPAGAHGSVRGPAECEGPVPNDKLASGDREFWEEKICAR